MLLTIGMPSYNNFTQVKWTVQTLRIYHNLTDVEILVVDNYGDDVLKNFCNGICRYERYTEKRGTAPAKNRVFEAAQGDFVICMDSHVMMFPGVIDDLKKFIRWVPGLPHLFHGPLTWNPLNEWVDRLIPGWATHGYGRWGKNLKPDEIPQTPYHIECHGMGLFGCFRQHWLKFPVACEGFGGEEFYIHTKYKRAGHKVVLLPFLKWWHDFHDQKSPLPYPLTEEDKIRNCSIGLDELGIDKTEMLKNFGRT